MAATSLAYACVVKTKKHLRPKIFGPNLAYVVRAGDNANVLIMRFGIGFRKRLRFQSPGRNCQPQVVVVLSLIEPDFEYSKKPKFSIKVGPWAERNSKVAPLQILLRQKRFLKKPFWTSVSYSVENHVFGQNLFRGRTLPTKKTEQNIRFKRLALHR